MRTSEAAEAGASRRNVDLPALVERLFATRRAQFGWFLILALLTRVSVFGDPGYHNDELLFFIVGQRMHDGLLPYANIWDRKGPGLFLVYYLAAGISRSVVSYQIAACLFAALTALAANMIAERLANRFGAILAGSLYLCMLPLFAGGAGQAPVFYNLFVALAALGVFGRLAELRGGRCDPRVYLAMTSAGFAITFKQTAMIEGAFFGCIVLWQLHRGGMALAKLAMVAVRLALAGAAPMLAFAAFFALSGHFAEFWHAMVTANLTKTYNGDGDVLTRIGALATIATPLLIPAIAAPFLRRRGRPLPFRFAAGWGAAALGGVAVVPNFIDHYMLPALLPLSVAAAPALGWRMIGPAYALFAMVFTLAAGPSLDFASRHASRQAVEGIVAEMKARDPRPRLFIYEGPPYLYALLDSYPPTPLLFPTHLYQVAERNTSYLDTAQEVRKVLAWRPTTVVKAHDFPGNLLNRETASMVDAYVAQCRSRVTRTVIDRYGPQKIDIHFGC